MHSNKNNYREKRDLQITQGLKKEDRHFTPCLKTNPAFKPPGSPSQLKQKKQTPGQEASPSACSPCPLGQSACCTNRKPEMTLPLQGGKEHAGHPPPCPSTAQPHQRGDSTLHPAGIPVTQPRSSPRQAVQGLQPRKITLHHKQLPWSQGPATPRHHRTSQRSQHPQEFSWINVS